MNSRISFLLHTLVGFNAFTRVGYQKSTNCQTFFTSEISPATTTTCERGQITIIDRYTYFTFEGEKVLFGVGESKLIQTLEKNAPLFSVAAENVIYRRDTDAVAFIRRAVTNKKGDPIAYGGHLAFPAGFFDTQDAVQSASGSATLSHNVLIEKMKLGALRELEEEAPALGTMLKHTSSTFKGFVSNDDRNVHCGNISLCIPSTSAVFLTELEQGPSFSIQGGDDAEGHHVVWVPRRTLLRLAKQFVPLIQEITMAPIDKKYTTHIFEVEDFAFDHLLIAEAALLC
jgi:8-oxo-dGTP pyrophosphatase MutT (NUDIX family)